MPNIFNRFSTLLYLKHWGSRLVGKWQFRVPASGVCTLKPLLSTLIVIDTWISFSFIHVLITVSRLTREDFIWNESGSNFRMRTPVWKDIWLFFYATSAFKWRHCYWHWRRPWDCCVVDRCLAFSKKYDSNFCVKESISFVFYKSGKGQGFFLNIISYLKHTKEHTKVVSLSSMFFAVRSGYYCPGYAGCFTC